MGIKDFFFRKQRQVEAHFREYLQQWERCAESFEKAMRVYFEKGNGTDFAYWAENTHKQESLADDLRREIEFRLYERAMLPESRGDILGLLEAVDKVINKLESVLFQIHLENIELPADMIPHLRRIFEVSREALPLAVQGCEGFFGARNSVMKIATEIDQKESECDHAERVALKYLFGSGAPWYTKLQLKNLIIEFGNITDRIEHVSDRLVILHVKRRV